MDSLKKEYAVESPAYQGIMVKPHPLAFKYCVGNGVELGASFHNSFNLPNCLNIAPSNGVDYLHLRDREDYMHWVKEQEKYAGAGNVARVDKIGDFRKIPADAESLDFVISSHVIEHEPNPIAGFLVLNTTPNGKYSITERQLSAMINGAAVATDANDYIEQCFPETSIIGFSHKDYKALADKLSYLLASPQKLEEIARNGEDAAKKNHTVRHRAANLIAVAETCKLLLS